MAVRFALGWRGRKRISSNLGAVFIYGGPENNLYFLVRKEAVVYYA